KADVLVTLRKDVNDPYGARRPFSSPPSFLLYQSEVGLAWEIGSVLPRDRRHSGEERPPLWLQVEWRCASQCPRDPRRSCSQQRDSPPPSRQKLSVACGLWATLHSENQSCRWAATRLSL